MSKYFTYFPQVFHTGEKLVNITKRAKFYESLQKDPYVFLPYTIQDDLRADQVANYYYGNSKYIWLVYLSNNIIDPLNEWPLSSGDFENMLIKKYADISGTTGFDVINWIMRTDITDNIIYYRNKEDPNLILSKESFTLSNDYSSDEWEAYRYYEYEDDLNNSRRTIYLLDRRFLSQVETEFKRIMNE